MTRCDVSRSMRRRWRAPNPNTSPDSRKRYHEAVVFLGKNAVVVDLAGSFGGAFTMWNVKGAFVVDLAA